MVARRFLDGQQGRDTVSRTEASRMTRDTRREISGARANVCLYSPARLGDALRSWSRTGRGAVRPRV